MEKTKENIEKEINRIEKNIESRNVYQERYSKLANAFYKVFMVSSVVAFSSILLLITDLMPILVTFIIFTSPATSAMIASIISAVVYDVKSDKLLNENIGSELNLSMLNFKLTMLNIEEKKQKTTNKIEETTLDNIVNQVIDEYYKEVPEGPTKTNDLNLTLK